MTNQEAEAWVRDKIVLKQRHTDECQEKLKVKEWEQVADSRKRRCACPYWSCGVHSPGSKFQRKATGVYSLDKAREVVLHRLASDDPNAKLVDRNRITVDAAVAEYMQYVTDGGAEKSTLVKYRTLMDQLKAFAKWKGIEFVSDLDQEAVLEFRRAWEDDEAGYKQNKTGHKGRRLWSKMSVKTAKRSAKTLKYFFEFAILRKWIKENPTVVLRFPKEDGNGRKSKEDIKYLSPDQMTDVVWACDKFDRMTPENRARLKALVLLMRHTGLRLGDAVRITADKLKGDVLFMETQKASTRVQIPLPAELVKLLKEITPYDGGYLFWNRQSDDTDERTPLTKYTTVLQTVFRRAGVKAKGDGKLAHMLRNTFAVDLLEKGVPLETVSLMLGHQSVTTTERYYADFSKGYMDRAEQIVRATWGMKQGEQLQMKVEGR